MKNYEMYNNDIKLGVTNICWENINNKHKNSIITSLKNTKYEIIKKLDNLQTYELEYILKNKDDLYDIVSKYIKGDKEIFKEIDKIKKYNNIKRLKKNQLIKILISEESLRCFNLSIKDVDLNSLINAKIFFIKKTCEIENINDIKIKLDKIVDNFKNIINSEEYKKYTKQDKNTIQNKASNMFDELIKIIEYKTNHKFGKEYIVPLKIYI